MTENEAYQMIKEELASMVWALSLSYTMLYKVGKVKFLPSDFADQHLINKSPYYDLADKILSLKVGQYSIGIVDEGAKLPHDDFKDEALRFARKLAREGMLQANFKKVISKEEE